MANEPGLPNMPIVWANLRQSWAWHTSTEGPEYSQARADQADAWLAEHDAEVEARVRAEVAAAIISADARTLARPYFAVGRKTLDIIAVVQARLSKIAEGGA